MNTEEIFSEIDRLYSENNIAKVEEYIIEKLGEAAKAGEENVMIQLLNELIGHYRETSEFDKLDTFAGKLLDILDSSSIKGSLAHATSLLNVANAYRAAGRLKESNKLYQEVKTYYDVNVPSDSMLYASLLNNMSLLFQEMGDHESAADCLERALGISLKYPECRIEQATTYANLATTLIKLDRLDEAEEHLTEAFRLFEQDEEPDYHYSAALSAMAEINYPRKESKASVGYYEKALVEIEKCVGRSKAYEITKQNMETAAAMIGREVGLMRGNDGKDDISSPESADGDAHSVKKDVTEQSCTETDAKHTKTRISGLKLSKLYYEKYGAPMIHEKFPKYEDRIATGLVGEGSECFGFDDGYSADHDFGPGFCMWLAKEDYKKIGKKLQREYDALPKEFMGYTRLDTANAGKRVGVFTIGKFYKKFTGLKRAPETDEEWTGINEAGIAHAVNGEVFRDDLGAFTWIRDRLNGYYPDNVWRCRIAQAAALMSQTGQYNYPRMLRRGDLVTATVYFSEFIRNTLQMLYLLNRTYAPYDKWMYKGLEKLGSVGKIPEKLGTLAGLGASQEGAGDVIEDICTEVLGMLVRCSLASGDDNYLDHHVQEILYGTYGTFMTPDTVPDEKDHKGTVKKDKETSAAKTGSEPVSKNALIDRIVELEWKAFDKVHNQGGRASCQDDFQTFSIMRKSQYMLWDEEMLESFISDFEEANKKGWNLITEKYGRMEETSAPAEYEKIKDSLPAIPEEKKQIIEAIVEIQTGMMEEFAKEYPKAAGEARSIHTSEDTPYNTSYETYLRGEISTYSDRTLSLYGRFVAGCARNGRNIAKETITNSALLYGYASLDDMERKL